MKEHAKLDLIFLVSLLLLSGCKFSINESAKKFANTADSTSFLVAKDALRFIQENKPDRLILLIDSRIRQKSTSDQINWLMKNGQRIFNHYLYPNDTSVLQTKSVNYSANGILAINTISFPFTNMTHKDSSIYFHITIVNNKIQRILINNLHPGINIIEPKRNEPHIQNFDLQTDNISWFRIWYDGGSKNKNVKYGLNSGYYAVSGNKRKLERIGVKNLLQDIFSLVNSAKFDSLDYKYFKEDELGDPEWIYLRIKFYNPQYKSLGEFEISYFINEENGKKELMSNYIVIKHTEKTRYLLLKDKNPELVQKLTEIAHKNYRRYYEIIP